MSNNVFKKPRINNALQIISNKRKKQLNKYSTKLTVLSGLLVLVVLTLAANALFSRPHSSARINPLSLAPITDRCAQQNTYTYGCYKKELTEITQKNGPETAIALVTQQYDKNPYVKSQCHQLTHLIGREALDKYKDLATTFVHGNYFCASGYYHGASEQIIIEKGSDYMKDNAQKICATFSKIGAYNLNHYNCVHGIGHGLLESTDGELFQALSGCDKLADEWERNSCYSGVFMQNVMREQVPDANGVKISKYLRTDEPMYPCTAVDDKYKGGCYIFQTSYALGRVGNNFSQVFNMCNDAGKYKYVCYLSLGRDASGINNLDQTQTIKNCYFGIENEAITGCVEGAAKNIVYSYHSDKQAYEFCDAIRENFLKDCRIAVRDYYATF